MDRKIWSWEEFSSVCGTAVLWFVTAFCWPLLSSLLTLHWRITAIDCIWSEIWLNRTRKLRRCKDDGRVWSYRVISALFSAITITANKLMASGIARVSKITNGYRASCVVASACKKCRGREDKWAKCVLSPGILIIIYLLVYRACVCSHQFDGVTIDTRLAEY